LLKTVTFTLFFAYSFSSPANSGFTLAPLAPLARWALLALLAQVLVVLAGGFRP